MFTVMIRYKESRREVLISARSVEFVPVGKEGEQPYDKAGLLINHAVEAEGGFHLDMTAKDDDNLRDVFVMNSNGKTVAKYTL